MKEEIDLLKLSICCDENGTEGLKVNMLPHALDDKELFPMICSSLATAMDEAEPVGRLLFCATLRFLRKKDPELSELITEHIAMKTEDRHKETPAKPLCLSVRPSGVKS